MISWERRPRLISHFLNPALVAVLIGESAAEYERSRHESMPWVLVFIVVPLVLHGPSRRALPRDTRTHLSTWVSRNPVVVAGFAERARGLAPRVREGLRHGVRCGALILDDQRVQSTFSGRRRVGQLDELIRAAGLIGRWLAKVDRPSTVYALLGVAP
jgi:hypothetical protein